MPLSTSTRVGSLVKTTGASASATTAPCACATQPALHTIVALSARTGVESKLLVGRASYGLDVRATTDVQCPFLPIVRAEPPFIRNEVDVGVCGPIAPIGLRDFDCKARGPRPCNRPGRNSSRLFRRGN